MCIPALNHFFFRSGLYFSRIGPRKNKEELIEKMRLLT